ncbi:MAG: hypothetical protein Fur0023_01200 [Bacteroidia bacterium]
MKWKKLKHIFCPKGEYEWMVSHAANPFVEILENSEWMVYFTSRDKFNRSHICALKINHSKDFSVTSVCKRPLVTPGSDGLFDDSGCAMGYLITINGRKHLYYLGWNLKVTVPWLNTIGLAIESGMGSDVFPLFEKYSMAPIMDRSHEDPFSISYPSILFENNIYRMWYGSNLSWGKEEKEMRHVFKYAESDDGIYWKRTNHVVLMHIYPNEFALSKPFVIKDRDIYKMWYSYRGRNEIKTYRIGYAESTDGFNWTRKDDEVGIDVSKEGWDSEMICYPFVFDFNGNRYMLYNGNGYGKTGFGIAILEQD